MKYNIGGLDDQLGVMIRRAFASRCISPQLKKEMGISHTKGSFFFLTTHSRNFFLKSFFSNLFLNSAVV
jgi:hypothetical protein